MIDNELLRKVLEVLILNGLPMVGVYWLMERPAVDMIIQGWDHILELLGVSMSEAKRYMAFILSVLVSITLFAVYASLGYETMPTSFEGWANVVLTLGMINFSGSTLIHGRKLGDG